MTNMNRSRLALAAAIVIAVAAVVIAVPAANSSSGKAWSVAWGIINRADSPDTATALD